MEQIEWKINGIFKADAQKVYDEISGMEITASNIVDYARKHKKSETYKCFEWDDKVAADKYRLDQATRLIRNFIIKREKPDDTPVRVFQITTERCVYQPTRLFLEQPSEYEALLKRAKAELESLKRRYSTLAELDEVFAAIDNL